jgi:hypothetical protein
MNFEVRALYERFRSDGVDMETGVFNTRRAAEA